RRLAGGALAVGAGERRRRLRGLPGRAGLALAAQGARPGPAAGGLSSEAVAPEASRGVLAGPSRRGAFSPAPGVSPRNRSRPLARPVVSRRLRRGPGRADRGPFS